MVVVALLRKRLKKEVKEMNAAFKEELEELEALEETEKCLEVLYGENFSATCTVNFSM